MFAWAPIPEKYSDKGSLYFSKLLLKKAGVAVLLLDGIKPIIVLLAILYISPEYFFEYKYLIFLFSIIGHIFPIWLNFKGGKGVACYFGGNLFLFPVPTILAMIIWFFTVKLSKLSSLGALLSIFLLTIYQLVFIYGNLEKGLVFVIFLLIFFKHNSNIKRLIKGEENKINL